MSVSTEQITKYLQQHGDLKVYGISANEYIFHGATALNKLGYWHWIKCFDPNKGFFMSENNHVANLATELDLDGHSCLTFACTMRILQQISKVFIEGDGPNETCTVCLSNEYNNNKTILECGHMFHEQCVISWFNYRLIEHGYKNCPLCRQNTLPDYDNRQK